VQLVTTVGFAILSDYFRQRAAIMSISTFFGFLSALLLAIWSIPSWLKWTAFFLGRTSVAYGPLAMSWANEICGSDAEERALVLGIMNAMGYAFNAWLPILVYPVKDAPRFKKGFIFNVGAFCVEGVVTAGVWWAWRRERGAEKIMLAEERAGVDVERREEGNEDVEDVEEVRNSIEGARAVVTEVV